MTNDEKPKARKAARKPSSQPLRKWHQPIFDKQDFEPLRAFQLFEKYRDMGAERSLMALGRDVDKSAQSLGETSKRFQWVKRADAYDLYLGQKRRLASERELEQMNRRHIQTAMLGFGQLVEYLVSGGLKHDLNGSNFARTLEALVKIERLARGVSTEIIETQQSPYQKRVRLARQSLEELASEFPTLSVREMVKIAAQDWRVEETDLGDVLSARLLTESESEPGDNSDGEE